MTDQTTFTTDTDARALIADLERELGVTGTAAVFRKALAMAKEAAAEVRARQDAFTANDLAYRLRCWGENDPDPKFFTGDLLHGVLLDCGHGSEAILAAEARAASAEASASALRDRVAVLESALKPFVEHADRYADWLRKAIAPNPHNEHFEAARAALKEATHV